MDDVAIIGVGLHPFGRFPGVSAIEMGAEAARLALADAGIAWKDVQFAFGGSYEVDNPDAVVELPRPDRPPVHRRLQRLRHRGQRADPGGATPSAWASTSSAWPSAWTSTCPARSPPIPVHYGVPELVRRDRASS